MYKIKDTVLLMIHEYTHRYTHAHTAKVYRQDMLRS